MSFLLDTNVLSELRKPRVDPRVAAWADGVRGDELFVSVLTIGEIRQGVERLRRRDPAQAGVFDAWLETLLRDYRKHTLEVTTEIAQRWGRLNVPDPLPVGYGLLAATAQAHGLTLVARTGVALLDPFAGS